MLLPSLLGAPASYERLRLHELVVRSDVIVTGEITAVGEDTFEFTVDDVVLGAPVPARLRLKQFQSWTCHARWAAYQRGQRLMLYLRMDASHSPGYFILGAGDEGEMPFLGDSVVMDGAHDYRVRGHAVKRHKVTGGTINGSKLAYLELRAAILGFREHFNWRFDSRKRLTLWSRNGLDAVANYARTSEIARHLSDSAQSSREWVGVRPAPDVLIERPGPGKMAASTTESPGPFLVRKNRGLVRGMFDLPRGRNQFSMALIGDVDGDGIGDLALGDPMASSSRGKRHGELWILFLDEQGNVRGRTEMSAEIAGFPARMNEFAALGKSVAALGDLDGDGVPDLVVGAPGWGGDSDRRGGAWVLFLKRDGTLKQARELGASEALLAIGVGEDFGLGNSLANLGDLDGDGTIELALGQDPGFDLQKKRAGRSILIVSLDGNAHVKSLRQIHEERDGFGADSSWLGDALCAVGDVDGNGTPDLAIADSGVDDGGDVRGAVWIVFLDKRLEILRKQRISNWFGNFEGPLRDWARFGTALGAPGDVDRDGVPDLLVGSSKRVWTLLLKPDGTVREHTETALEDKAIGAQLSFGGAIACPPLPAAGAASEVLILGGSVPDLSALWWLRLGTDGTLCSR